jgi:hypothetical protein
VRHIAYWGPADIPPGIILAFASDLVNSNTVLAGVKPQLERPEKGGRKTSMVFETEEGKREFARLDRIYRDTINPMPDPIGDWASFTFLCVALVVFAWISLDTRRALTAIFLGQNCSSRSRRTTPKTT